MMRRFTHCRQRRVTLGFIASGLLVPAVCALAAAPEVQPLFPPSAAPELAVVTPPPPLALPSQDLAEIHHGWDVREGVLDAEVFDDVGKPIGLIDAVFVVPRTGNAYAVLDAGDYVGSGDHVVVVALARLTRTADGYQLLGATKEAVKALPAFSYPR